MAPTIELNAVYLAKLMQAIYDMRQTQKEYFEQPSQYRLKIAKAKESLVDIMLLEVIKAGYIKEKKQVAATSGTLF